MTESGDAKPSGVPIAELDIEQISALQRQVEQELGFFQESANQLKVSFSYATGALIRKNDQSIASMEVLKTATPGHTALIPLSESVETIEKIIGDKKRTRNIISETLQSKIQAQLAQMPLPK
ncbi:hypothetical protein ANCCEY_14293 [Ancylostoma ceylanicum]|uniref:Prefoldin subunit n=1 Tax=Ancylostoma ceylanicum TaxID=53326 RepID=A0A0D6L5S6_9BILA|nr:hypothetical protein ANCCEY_14293 [Ancylostoma ceylanicum]